MTDSRYVERQMRLYQQSQTEEQQDDHLYRAGTDMGVIPCDGNSQLTPEKRQAVLDAYARGIHQQQEVEGV